MRHGHCATKVHNTNEWMVMWQWLLSGNTLVSKLEQHVQIESCDHHTDLQVKCTVRWHMTAHHGSHVPISIHMFIRHVFLVSLHFFCYVNLTHFDKDIVHTCANCSWYPSACTVAAIMDIELCYIIGNITFLGTPWLWLSLRKVCFCSSLGEEKRCIHWSKQQGSQCNGRQDREQESSSQGQGQHYSWTWWGC